MKIYFDGCSNTAGSELKDAKKTRFSKLVCDHFNAEEYNIGLFSGSDRRMARNLLEHDLSQYDMFVIQLTQKARSEYWCERDKKWKVLRHLLKEKDRFITPLHSPSLDQNLQPDYDKIQVSNVWKKFLKNVYILEN